MVFKHVFINQFYLLVTFFFFTVSVRALQILKSKLGLPMRLGWNGDPCVPQQHPWSGADCQFDRRSSKWVIDGLYFLVLAPYFVILKLSYFSFSDFIQTNQGNIAFVNKCIVFSCSVLLTTKVSKVFCLMRYLNCIIYKACEFQTLDTQ